MNTHFRVTEPQAQMEEESYLSEHPEEHTSYNWGPDGHIWVGWTPTTRMWREICICESAGGGETTLPDLTKIKSYVEAGANVNALHPLSRTPYTPLMYAIWSGETWGYKLMLDITKYLLEQGADPNAAFPMHNSHYSAFAEEGDELEEPLAGLLIQHYLQEIVFKVLNTKHLREKENIFDELEEMADMHNNAVVSYIRKYTSIQNKCRDIGSPVFTNDAILNQFRYMDLEQSLKTYLTH